MTQLSLSLLGHFEATVGTERVPDSRGKVNEFLLIYLATEHDRAHRRENLVRLLIPELPDDQAIQIVYRQIEIEPWHEGAHRQIMRSKAYLGQRNNALRHSDSFRKKLHLDLGVEPMPENESRRHNLSLRNQTFVRRS